MKKIAMFMSALALAFTFASCDKEGKDPIDLDNVTEDGFYVAGPATGAADIAADYMMTAGVNEVLMNDEKKPWAEAKRAGMYEKYIVLEGGKDFELLLYANGEKIRYSAVLADYDTKELGENPIEPYNILKRGSLKTGPEAPAMQVAKTGLYHIVLDLNEGNDLAFGAQIVVAPVTMGVRGGMNGWGFTAFPEPAKYTNEGITWVLEEQSLAKGGKFKFAYNHAWKIQLDDAGKVKAHTNLGEGAVNGATDIKVEKGDTIYAAFDGKVRITAFQRRGYGHYVVIRHNNGIETLYAHLSKKLVNENQNVKAGDPIGLGGNTGRSTGSHLHFETILLGKCIDPALLFDFPNQDVTGDHYVYRKPGTRLSLIHISEPTRLRRISVAGLWL